MKKATILIIFASFIILVLLANNMHAVLPELAGLQAQYKELPWYQVEQWEQDVCSKWGGTGTAGQEAVTAGRKISWAAMTATMQGKRFKTPEKYSVYEVAWYFDSFTERTDYELTMINPKIPALRYLVDSGSLAPEAGTIGYETYNLTEDYTHLKLKYTGGSITTSIISVGR